MRGQCMLLFAGLVFFSAAGLFGQGPLDDKSKVCTARPLNKGKYKILSIEPGGIESQFYLEIQPKYRTDENYLAIAKEFKERFCHENQLRIMYFAGKRNWMIEDPKKLEGTPLAIFYFYKDKKKEGIEVYKIVNGKIETRNLDIAQKD